MICFPLDNTEYDASALGAWFGTRTRGITAADGHFITTANGNMTVTVSAGLAWLRAATHWGVCAMEVDPTTLSIDTSHGSLVRIDIVCLRLNRITNQAELIIKKGADFASNPTFAAPVRDLDFDEIYLASVRVRAGAIEVQPNDIVDLRLNEEYCGIMRDGITTIPTQALYNRFEAFMQALNGLLENGDIAGQLQGQINAIKAGYLPNETLNGFKMNGNINMANNYIDNALFR